MIMVWGERMQVMPAVKEKRETQMKHGRVIKRRIKNSALIPVCLQFSSHVTGQSQVTFMQPYPHLSLSPV